MSGHRPDRIVLSVRARPVSCGVIVTDCTGLLLGHATRSPRWDIPKGLANPGEPGAMAAARELLEETGLAVPVAELRDLGTHAYLPRKDLALFAWLPAVMPDPATLICSSMVQRPGLHDMPELDRFGVFAFAAAQALVGRNLARVLRDVWPGLASGQAGSAG